MQVLKLSLIVAVMLSLSACCTTPSVPPIPRQVPEVCLKACPTVPEPADGSDRSIRLWEYEVIDASGTCRRVHSECVDGHVKEM